VQIPTLELVVFPVKVELLLVAEGTPDGVIEKFRQADFAPAIGALPIYRFVFSAQVSHDNPRVNDNDSHQNYWGSKEKGVLFLNQGDNLVVLCVWSCRVDIYT
jgi:hypothetical protein